MRLCRPVAPAPALVPCWAFPTAPSQPLATPGATEHPTIRPTQPVNPIDATTATRPRGGGDAVLRPHRSRRIRGRRRRPRSRWDARPAEALAYTRVHPEVMVEPVVDPAASDRHRATSASVAIGSLHTNKTAHGAGHGAKLRIPESTN
jgi:hypothetical protein